MAARQQQQIENQQQMLVAKVSHGAGQGCPQAAPTVGPTWSATWALKLHRAEMSGTEHTQDQAQ